MEILPSSELTLSHNSVGYVLARSNITMLASYARHVKLLMGNFDWGPISCINIISMHWPADPTVPGLNPACRHG